MLKYCYNPHYPATGAIWEVVKGIVFHRENGLCDYSVILQSKDNDRDVVEACEFGYFSKTEEQVFQMIVNEWFPSTVILHHHQPTRPGSVRTAAVKLVTELNKLGDSTGDAVRSALLDLETALEREK